jgi:hypothetical protein
VDAKPIETDYLVIGGGATAMAFVDTLLSESDAQMGAKARIAATKLPALRSAIAIA